MFPGKREQNGNKTCNIKVMPTTFWVKHKCNFCSYQRRRRDKKKRRDAGSDKPADDDDHLADAHVDDLLLIPVIKEEIFLYSLLQKVVQNSLLRKCVYQHISQGNQQEANDLACLTNFLERRNSFFIPDDDTHHLLVHPMILL